MAGQRIALFGGTFDPIHCAHLAVAEAAAGKFALDRVLFVPAAHPPHKPEQEVSMYEDRFRMVEIACAPFPAFVASRLEEGEKRSYTIDTVKRFRKQITGSDELFFLIGSDAFNELETWHRWRELVKLTEFIVVSRPGVQYRNPEGARVYALEGLALPVSSSTIRERLAAGDPTPELPSGVRSFIEERGLYGVRRAIALPSRSTDRMRR